MQTRSHGRKGFSLLEVSLAVIVASIALISIISMIPVGLDANRKALEATRAGQFADDILSGVVAAAQQYPKYADFKTKFVQGSTFKFDVSSRAFWDTGKTTSLTITADGQRNKVEFFAQMNNGATPYATHGAWYRVTISNANSLFSVKRVRVEVWPNLLYNDASKNAVTVETFVTCQDLQNEIN